MKLIKLNAIGSTNTFLKELAQNSSLENYTVVTCNEQTLGRGQVKNSWHTQPFKNLTFSLFTQFKQLKIEHQSCLNFAVSLAVFNTLESISIPNLRIKWPNDIMSGNKKLCGILIETTFTQQYIKNTVIGIGLNVNQEVFPSQLTNASSLKLLMKKDFNLDTILFKIVENLKHYLKDLEVEKFQNIIHKNYNKQLYKKDIPITFKDEKTQLFFMGIIKGVTPKGNLQIQLENDLIKEFAIKEISFAKV